MRNKEEANKLSELAKAKKKLASQNANSQEDMYAEMRGEIAPTNKEVSYEYAEAPVMSQDDYEAPVDTKDEDDYSYLAEAAPPLREYDRRLFEGGPTETELDTWKKTWEGYNIYFVEIVGKTFIFRTINRFEYKQIVMRLNTDPLQREELICRTATLFPYDYSSKDMVGELAGIPTSYSQVIMEKSGFTEKYAIEVL